MALSKTLALLSAVATLLLLARALQPSHRAADALLLLDRLSDLLDLATRRNMVLLCHAILLVLLGDAGLLSHPARRRRAEATCYNSSDSAHARSGDVLWRRRARNSTSPYEPHTKNAAVAVEDPWAATTTEPERLQVDEHVSIKEIILVERQVMTSLHGRYHLVMAAADELHHPSATDEGKTISPIDFFHRAVVGDREKNGTGEETAEGELPKEEWAVEEEEEDLDEMNRRFEAFIAITKEKMRLEALHPPSASNRPLLLLA